MSNETIDVVRETLGKIAAVLMKVVNMVFMVLDKIVYVLDRSFNALMTQCFKNSLFIVLLLFVVIFLIQLESSFVNTIFGERDNKDNIVFVKSITAWLLLLWFIVLIISRSS